MGKVALYRKYRPSAFDELYGQDHIGTTLKNSVKSGNFAHAYLFSGSRGTGKTSVARILAKAINCEHSKDGNPDNSCENCKMINTDKAMDIIEIDAASHTQVDNIREVIVERAKFAPTHLKYKVYIIDEAHMLSKSSFNALLKTLEEPPAHVVFILATTEPNKIIPTIVSRCQKFDFKRINLKDMITRLDFIAKEENISLEAGITELIAINSEGGFRDAISLLDQIGSAVSGTITKADLENILGITDSQIVEDFAAAILVKDEQKALSIIEKVVAEGHDLGQFNKILTEYIRKLMILKVVGEGGTEFSAEALIRAKKYIAGSDLQSILEIIDQLVENEKLYRSSSIPQLGLEVSAIKLCSTKFSENVKTVSNELVNSKKAVETKGKEEKVAQPKKSTNGKNEGTKWQQLLLEIKGKNNSIHAFLKVCEPNFEDNNTVCLNFPYKFHKERIEDVKNRQIVESALLRVYGVQYKVKCALKPMIGQAIGPEKSRKDDLLEEALEILGGEVIE